MPFVAFVANITHLWLTQKPGYEEREKIIMNENISVAIPKSFYVIAGIGLVWNLIGVVTYVMQVTMTPESIAALPAEQQAMYTDIPAWATSAYAIAVNAGVIGCVLLLLRKQLALAFLVLSLAGVTVQFSHALLLTDAIAVMGATVAIGPFFICLIGIFLIWFALYSRNNGWLS